MVIDCIIDPSNSCISSSEKNKQLMDTSASLDEAEEGE